MEENTNVVVNDSENSEEKLTGGEKAIVLGAAVVCGGLGYVIGTYIIAPVCRKIGAAISGEKEKKPRKTLKAKRSESGVDYDEDGDFRETDGD